MDWREGEVRELGLDEFDQPFARYRLQVDESTRQAMIASLRRFGQLSPVVVCQLGGSLALVDGFKRHQAAGETKGMDGLSAPRIEADESSAKAAIYSLNCLVRRMHELEEAWIVYGLVREDGLTQLQAAELLGRHKSWACRRLAMLEKLSDEVRGDLRLGLPAHPYDTARVVYRVVDVEGFVSYERNSYSVPWRLVGQMLAIRITENDVPRAMERAVRYRASEKAT